MRKGGRERKEGKRKEYENRDERVLLVVPFFFFLLSVCVC